MNDYFDQLKILVQETYSSNAKKVALLCHSMGCIRAVHFLNQQPQEWKAQYVEKLVMLGAPMGGSMEVLSPLLVGEFSQPQLKAVIFDVLSNRNKLRSIFLRRQQV